MVDRQGVLVLIYQKPVGQRYGRLRVNLSTVPEGFFTHAAFAPTAEGRLLITTYTSTGTLAVYAVQVNWPDFRQNPNADIVPQLSVEIINSDVPTTVSQATGADGISDGTYDSDALQLTHLEMIPTTDIDKAEQVPPTIHALYAWINKNMDITQSGYFIASMVKRWAVTSVEEKLHPRFDEMSTKTNTVSEPLYRLAVQRRPNHSFDQVVTSYQLVDASQTLAVAKSDGSVDFLNPATMASWSMQGEPNEVTSMPQSGYTFPNIDLPYNIAYSPNLCTMATLDTESKVVMSSMGTHQGAAQGLEANTSNLEILVAALILNLARACNTALSYDDIIACTLHTFRSEHIPVIARSMYRTLFQEKEFLHEKIPGSELDKVVQKPMVLKVLSYHYAVATSARPRTDMMPDGFADGTSNRATLINTHWLWMAINLRQTATLMYVLYKFVQDPNVKMASDFINVMCQHVKWSMDIFRFILDTILEIGDRQTNPDFFDPPDPTRIGQNADCGQGLVALLLNTQWSRSFMAAITRALRAFFKLHPGHNTALQKVQAAIQQQSMGRGLTLLAIEKMLDPRWYVAADESQTDDHALAAQRQVDMMATGVVPDAYSGNVKRILTDLVNANGGLRDKGEIDRLKMFTDSQEMEWVLLRPGERYGKRRIVFDVHKRIPLPRKQLGGKQVLRRCVRCGSWNEDLDGVPKEWLQALKPFMARCVCDGGWVVEQFE